MASQARSDRSLRLVLSGASADVTLVISDPAERPLATMVLPPGQLRDIVQSFGSMLALVEGEAKSGTLPSTAPWQITGVVFDQPAWRVAQEPATGLVVLSLQVGPSASWSFALSPEDARHLGRSLGEVVGGEPVPAEAPPEEPAALAGEPEQPA